MRQKPVKRVGVFCMSLAVLVATLVSTGRIAAEGVFTPSTVTLPSNMTLTTVKNFDDGLQGFKAGNSGENNDGSGVEHCTTLGYGTSGGSIQWTYDKSKAPDACVLDGAEDFYAADGDGFFLWIKADATGKVRLQGLNNDWNSIYCDAEVATGENLVYFPYSSFKKGEEAAPAFTLLGYHICLYPIGMPNAGTMYVDAFGTYKEGAIPTTDTDVSDSTLPTTPDQPEEHNPDYHKLIDNFEVYTSDRGLIDTWSAINTGESGEGCVMTLDTSGENSVSGNSVKLIYNAANAQWCSPGTQKRKPDNQDLEGDGFCFWLKTEKAMSMRVAYLTEDAEAVFDIKNIPAGYEGYYHVPFSDVKYFQAGIEVPYEELGFEPSDFYYFTFYVYGPNSQWEDYENTVWFDELSFYASESFDAEDTTNTTIMPDTAETTAESKPADNVNTGVRMPLAAGAAVLVFVGAALATGKRRR